MKRMLIDDTQPEETRVVIVDGNKVEDVEFESSNRRQIKGNIYTAKVIRIEPSLQAAFVDYGGNRHGFLAFGEIHPDYYNISDEVRAEIEAEVDEIIERKRQYQAERKAEQERRRLEREQKRAEYEAQKKALEEAAQNALPEEETSENNTDTVDSSTENYATEECHCSSECACRQQDGHCHCHENGVCTCNEECCCHKEDEEYSHCEECCCAHETADANEYTCETAETNTEETDSDDCLASEPTEQTVEEILDEEDVSTIETEDGEYSEVSLQSEESETSEEENKRTRRPHRRGTRFLGRGRGKKYKISAEAAGLGNEEMISEEVSEEDAYEEDDAEALSANDNRDYNNESDEDDEDTNSEHYLEIQRKLIYARKLYHRSTIQEVIKEGQTLLIQIVKEERGNKGAACTTYLSLAGRYCVLMPNRIKSGGVSRKITSANDRKRLKDIMHELPLNDDMSLIIRTAGEDKNKGDIVRDYNYLIRTWNHIRHSALSCAAPSMIYEEGNLIKRALRDMYTKDISEVIIDGDAAYKTAKDFSKILSPNMGRKIKCRKPGELPVFQHYQVEKELDKLHNPVVQLESGGYLVINPTEALVSIDVNSGRATHEMDIEETALKTNLEAADEIAKQLRMRNLAGLVVVDFIDMEEPANNHAVEKRMKEAMKPDRARVQIAKMSIFGLLEISRQRMHSSFVESNYITCPYCRGQGVQRTAESSGTLVLRAIEEEGIKGNYNHLEVRLPEDTAIYILNHKRRNLADLEEKYGLEIIISADKSIKNICDYRIEKSKLVKAKEQTAPTASYMPTEDDSYSENDSYNEETSEEYTEQENKDSRQNNRRNRYDRKRNRGRRGRNNNRHKDNYQSEENTPEQNTNSSTKQAEDSSPKEEKKTWWKKLIG